MTGPAHEPVTRDCSGLGEPSYTVDAEFYTIVENVSYFSFEKTIFYNMLYDESGPLYGYSDKLVFYSCKIIVPPF
jgi:hypothetical protein